MISQESMNASVSRLLRVKMISVREKGFEDINNLFASFGAFGNALELAEVMTVEGYDQIRFAVAQCAQDESGGFEFVLWRPSSLRLHPIAVYCVALRPAALPRIQKYASRLRSCAPCLR